MSPEQLQQLLQQVRDRSIGIDEAVEKLRHLPFEDLGFARIDHHRQIRCGFPEVIYCPSKTPEQIAEILVRLSHKGNNILATRATEEVFEFVQGHARLEGLRYEKAARIIVLEQTPVEKSEGTVCIVTAGTADLPVAREAQVTAEMLGSRTRLICDVGVAGLHRLFDHLPMLNEADVVIVVAGMEGALASVVGGLLCCPIIAVPTSVGYGASFEGLAALLTMLNSCASGVTVVNIDNGFGAAYAARQIQRKITEVQRRGS